MDNHISLKLTTERDLAAIEKILTENNLPASDISEKLGELFLIQLGDRAIGIGGIENYRPFGLLRSLVIEESLRGKGLGKIAGDRLIRQARILGIEELYLLTTTAVAFFTQLGFEKTARDTVPPVIQNTSQFSYLCPQIAVCMKRKLTMKKVMFVCKRNSCRSQMAEGFAKTLGQGKIEVTSSGLEASRVHPTAIEVMADTGIDISHQTSDPLSDFAAENYDAVISMCGCGTNLPPEWVSQEVFEDWELDDPDGQAIETFYRVRDEIKERVKQLIDRLS